jgi:hypothetical protein
VVARELYVYVGANKTALSMLKAHSAIRARNIAV